MRRITVVLGAGGTGSYAIPNLANIYQMDEEAENHLVVLDGDLIEHKNLLRQGFLVKDLNNFKAESLVKRYGRAFPDLPIYYSNTYVNDVHGLESVIHVVARNQQVDELILISCVDNNYARLRMLLAQFRLFEKYKCDVYFVDSGNEEWHGQVIPSKLAKGVANPVRFNGTTMVVNEDVADGHSLDSIFVGMGNWRDRLTRGDHELSCDEVTVSHPQNIGTNMMAATCILQAVNQIIRKEDVEQLTFNSKTNAVKVAERCSVEAFRELLDDISTFVNTEDTAIIGDSLIPVIQVNRAYGEELVQGIQNAVNTDTAETDVDDLVRDFLGLFDDTDPAEYFEETDILDFPDWLDDLLE